MILVVGSTGHLGGEVTRRLVGRGHAVRALVRPGADAAALDALEQAGVQLARGDLKDVASLAHACAGVHTVISTANATRSRREGDSIETVDGRGQQDLVDAAAAAGVEHFILVSVAGSTGDEDPLSRAKRAVEQKLQRSGLHYTILRPNTFMEVWLSPALGFDYIGGNVKLFGSGERPISYISADDVAEYVVRSVANPAVANRTFELGGPESLPPLAIVKTFERLAGRAFNVQHVPEEALVAQRDAAPDSLARTFASLMLCCARGFESPAEPARSLYGMNLRTVEQYAAAVLAPLARQARTP